MPEIPAEDTPIYTQLRKEYDAKEELSRYFDALIPIYYERSPLHAND